MNNEYPVYMKWRCVAEYLIGICGKFPKNVRFSLCNRITNISLEVLESIIEAIYATDKAPILRQANLQIEKLRALIQISVNNRYLSLGQYEHVSREIDDAGRMIGGWLKS